LKTITNRRYFTNKIGQWRIDSFFYANRLRHHHVKFEMDDKFSLRNDTFLRSQIKRIDKKTTRGDLRSRLFANNSPLLHLSVKPTVTMLHSSIIRSSLNRINIPLRHCRCSTVGLSFCQRKFSSTSGGALQQKGVSAYIPHPIASTIRPQEWKINNDVSAMMKQVDHGPNSDDVAYGENPRISILMELQDTVGVLHDVLKFFWKFDVNICRIESRPLEGRWGHKRFDFFVDFEGSRGDENVEKLLSAVKPMTNKLLLLDEKHVHWFPRHISELDLVANRTLDAGVDLESDHPGFNDSVYRTRRAHLAVSAQNHRWDQPIPYIEYTTQETRVWAAVWSKMEPLWAAHACKEYLHSLDLLKHHAGYDSESIPQQQDISNFLMQRTGFRMRPVAGLLSSRDFLNGLAFRVFFSTQYIRHHSKPLYTPEPDICHELLGHAPMFADRDFAGN
jgi:hypothetical protein